MANPSFIIMAEVTPHKGKDAKPTEMGIQVNSSPYNEQLNNEYFVRDKRVLPFEPGLHFMRITYEGMEEVLTRSGKKEQRPQYTFSRVITGVASYDDRIIAAFAQKELENASGIQAAFALPPSKRRKQEQSSLKLTFDQATDLIKQMMAASADQNAVELKIGELANEHGYADAQVKQLKKLAGIS